MKIEKINFFTARNREEKFVRSLKETGFAIVTGGPIPGDMLKDTYKDWAAFFANSKLKLSHTFDPETQSGFFPMRSENAKDSSAKDLKEFYHIFKAQDIPEGFSPATLMLRSQLLQMAEIMLDWIQKFSPKEVSSNFSMPLREMVKSSEKSLFRILHYPPLLPGMPKGEVRAAAHEDINLITLLPSATEAGLEVLDSEGVWHKVQSDPNSIVVNAGDMLQMASGGYFKSTTHRVVNPIGDAARFSRYSLPFFLHPKGDVILSPKESGRQITAAQYLAERLREIGLKK